MKDADSFPPSLADRYRPVRRLAVGGFGEVWEATQAATGRAVALKLPRAPEAADSVELRRFHEEARATASLAHPHVVEVVAWSGQDPDAPLSDVPWITLDSQKAGLLGRLTGVAADAPLPVPPEVHGPVEESTHVEIHCVSASKEIWESADLVLPGPHGAPDSVRGLAASALSLRLCSEVPHYMNLLDDGSGKVRVHWHIDAEEIRRRSHGLLADLAVPLAARPARWDAWHYLGWILANGDQRPQARRALARALRIWPTSSWSWLECARLEERELRVLTERRAPRDQRAAALDRMGLAGSLAHRYLPVEACPLVRRMRDDALDLHRRAVDGRARLQ